MTEYELYLEREWEIRQRESRRGLWRGIKFAALFVAPFWILFLYFCLR